MIKNFVEELKWRGMLAQIMPGTEEFLNEHLVSAYLGTDPTADSLHIGHLCGIMMLRHLQRCGHKPIILVGGATAMIGDPSGKSQERNLLDDTTIRHNQECIKKQVAKFLDFDSEAPNKAEMVNNYDWMKNFTFLDFAREVGKHITVNYMMAKESVQQRLNGTARDGLSFTEFTYQLLQGYDFLYLYQNNGVRLQLGGNDQWGNMTTGTELIRRTLGSEAEPAFALTCPLITKSDGKKFGKTESGNIWLDPQRTTPYKFYQFWLNTSDEDAERYIKIFTSLDKETIDALVEEHQQDPGRRVLQRRLAEEVTEMVHSKEALEAAIEASSILFGKSTKEGLEKLDEATFLDVFDGVPHYDIDRDVLGFPAVEVFTQSAPIFSSKGEMRKMVQGGGVSLNKEKLNAFERPITEDDLIDGKYLLVQKGKKNYFLLTVK
ncbi:MAG: tyrosine--tRNA ligase [Prevotella sp.]|nr:tyrosine--tRNA ligase [Prevotella sp.]